jgi:hypothetical protein
LEPLICQIVFNQHIVSLLAIKFGLELVNLNGIPLDLLVHFLYFSAMGPIMVLLHLRHGGFIHLLRSPDILLHLLDKGVLGLHLIISLISLAHFLDG